jgi:arylsulfatase A-like enzyme
VAVGLAGCGDSEPRSVPDSIGVAPSRCLIVVLDAAAASHFAYSGYARQTTPRLDARVAERGFLFSNAHGNTASVLPAAISALTGRYLMGPADSTPRYRMPEDALTYLDSFRAAGFATAAFSESPLIVEEFGLRGEFDTWRTFPGIRKIKSRHARPRHHPATKQLLGAATTWIKKRQGTPWLAYLQIMRPHSPYFASRPYEAIYTERWYSWSGSAMTEVGVRLDPARVGAQALRYFSDLYDENLTAADAHVMDLIEDLEAKGALDDTLIVITSGHGEAFLEHGHLYHDVSVYDEVTRVPLIFLPPKGLEIAPGSSDERVELVDLFPTLLDLFRQERPRGLSGHSLVPLMRGGTLPADRTTIAQTADATRFAFTRGGRKLILHVEPGHVSPTGYELYDLAADPGEQHDLAGQGEDDAELRAAGVAHIQRVLATRSQANPPLSEDKHYELEIIGYLELRKEKSRGL